jgi:Plasmid pRiA4b ORF-3-like protein
MAPSATLIFRASLRRRLYRDIELTGASTLAELAEAIVAAFGFDMDHAYGFYSKLTGKLFDSPRRFELFADIEGQSSRSVESTRVITAFPKVGSIMTFLYDFGDEWRFRVKLLELDWQSLELLTRGSSAGSAPLPCSTPTSRINEAH